MGNAGIDRGEGWGLGSVWFNRSIAPPSRSESKKGRSILPTEDLPSMTIRLITIRDMVSGDEYEFWNEDELNEFMLTRYKYNELGRLRIKSIRE